jgi:predicted permease
MLVDTDLNMAGYKNDAIPAMQKRMIDAMKAIPGVKKVGLVDVTPLYGMWTSSNIFSDKTTDLRPSNAAAEVITYNISPDYFEAAGTALISGRTFTWHDDKNVPRVAVINRALASKIFASETDAMGRAFKLQDGTRVQVVGIVEDGKYGNLTEDPKSAMFLPILQSPSSSTWLVVRSDRDFQQLAAALRRTVRDLDPGLTVTIGPWNKELDSALFGSRMATVSLGVLGVMGAMLSITGIFGVAAYSVSKRQRELGIRTALGAQRNQVLNTALGRPLKLLAFGSIAGVILGVLASRVLALIVYQATPRDPMVLGAVVLAMLLIGLVGTWIPAMRALSVNPLKLLREQ